GLFPAVLPSQLCHGGNRVGSHVFHPFAHFLYRAGTHVAVDIRLTTHLTAEFQKLMSTEGIILGYAAPVGVDHTLAALLGADSVFPVVVVGKPAAGPAEDRHPDMTKGFYHIRAHSLFIGNRRILPDKYAVVNAPAQVLGKMAIQIPVYDRFFMGGID